VEIEPVALLEIVVVASIAFLSTGFDNLGVLVAGFATRELDARRIAAGYIVASALVVVASLAGANLVELAPLGAIAYLGVLPIALGLRQLWQLRTRTTQVPQERALRGGLSVAVVTLAQSADNVVVFVSLFADTSRALDATVLMTLLAWSVAWTVAAFWLARHSPLADLLGRAMRVMLPFLLIAVGVYILLDTATDVAPQ
jgi:cadmium resistance protein CadD (predicted permease)